MIICGYNLEVIMTIFRNTRNGKLYTVTYSYGRMPGVKEAHPYNRPGKSFIIKSNAAWKAFIPVAYR